MRAAWTLVPLLLAGCAAPGPVMEVPLHEAEPLAVGCEAKCSWEWWNATVDAEGPWSARLPLPVAFGPPGPSAAQAHAAAWRVRLDQGAASVAASAEGAWAELRGDGPGRASGHVARVAPAYETADGFLLARWGPAADDVRPDALAARLDERVRALAVTYEAHSDLCERRAAYTLAPRGEGDPALVGSDAARCG